MRTVRFNSSIRINIFLIILLIVVCVVVMTVVFDGKNDTSTTTLNKKIDTSITLLYKNYTQDYVIEETIKFANRGVEEDDPELIQFVQKLIKPPSNIKYNFANPNKPNSDYSQDGQSVYIDELLKKRTDGFYIGKLII